MVQTSKNGPGEVFELDCEQAQEQIMDYVDHPEQVSPDVREHLKDCPDCQQDVTSIQRISHLMEEHRSSMETPQSLRTRVKQTLQENGRETVGRVTLLLAFLSGLGLAGIAVSSLPVDLATHWLVTCSLWWGGLFVMGTTLMVGGIRLATSRTSGIATVSTVSAGGIFGGLYLCPGVQGMTGLADFVGLNQILQTVVGPALSYLLVGFVFASIPTALVSTMVARDLGKHRVHASGVASLGFLLLIAPLLYVECSLLPSLGSVLLLLGVTIGSLGGPLGGFILKPRLPVP